LRLAGQHADIDGALRQAKLLADRAGDLDDRINDRRRELFTSRLTARSSTVFDAAFWADLAESVPAELRALAGLAQLWGVFARTNGGIGGMLAAAPTFAALGAAAWFALRWQRHLAAEPTPRRFDKALSALLILGASVATPPVLIMACVLVL